MTETGGEGNQEVINEWFEAWCLFQLTLHKTLSSSCIQMQKKNKNLAQLEFSLKKKKPKQQLIHNIFLKLIHNIYT